MHMNRFKIMLKCRCPFSMSGLRLEALYFLQALSAAMLSTPAL